jgi:hypothetical protein
MVTRTAAIRGSNHNNALLTAAAILTLSSVVVMSLVFFVDLKPTNSEPFLFLIPWILALAVVFAIPPLVMYRRGELTLDNPIIFATWSYFFPAFVVGGFSLCFGWSQPFFLDHIQDPQINLPFTVLLIIAGYLALFAGYMGTIGAKIGGWLEKFLPNRDYDETSCIGPGTVLLVLGILTTVFAFVLGIIGFQLGDEINSYDGLIIATTQLWVEASFVLCFILFRRAKWDIIGAGISAVLLFTFIARALFAGNRGSLLTFFSIVLLAYVLAGRTFKFRQATVAGCVLVVCVIAGMIYGTAFRSVKGTESRISIGDYTDNIFDTLDQVGQKDSISVLETATSTLAERIDTISSVAVVVSNYEQLLPYEEQYGLDNNIWKDLTTFFVPRILWPGKPVASDARKYGDLYFDYGENSFAITPIGDLLRNFGVAGVPIGMFLLGILLRVLYRTFVENQGRVLWRCAIYFMLLTAISYEGFYGLIIPNMVKSGVIAVIGVLLITFFATRKQAESPGIDGLAGQRV